MEANVEHVAGYIAVGLVSLVVGLILQRLKDRPKLLYWIPGSFLFQLKTPVIALRTDSLTIQNVGHLPATNIEIVHKMRPDHFQFSTQIDFSEVLTPSGEHVIKIPSLGAQEHVNIQLLSYSNEPFLLNVRSAEGRAQLIQVHLQRVIPKAVQLLAGLLALFGAGILLYWVISGIILLSHATLVIPS
jgi:energy-converting hydrogenase Eha subunit A